MLGCAGGTAVTGGGADSRRAGLPSSAGPAPGQLRPSEGSKGRGKQRRPRKRKPAEPCRLPAGLAVPSRAGMGESTSPISVILVSSGSRGNKLLFRFPFQRGAEHPAAQASKCVQPLGSAPSRAEPSAGAPAPEPLAQLTALCVSWCAPPARPCGVTVPSSPQWLVCGTPEAASPF